MRKEEERETKRERGNEEKWVGDERGIRKEREREGKRGKGRNEERGEKGKGEYFECTAALLDIYQYKSFSHSIIHCCLRLDPRGRLSYLLKINLDIINLCAIFSTDELHHHLQYIFLHIRGYFQVDAEDGSRNTKTKALLRVHPAV